MASRCKKPWNNTLFLATLDDSKISTSFYGKKQGYGKQIWVCLYF